MFLIDSITNHRSTEPVWFRFFRGFFAITLTGVIMFYLTIQFKKIGTEASTIITLERFSKSQLNMTLHTGIYEIGNVKALLPSPILLGSYDIGNVKALLPNGDIVSDFIELIKHNEREPYYLDMSLSFNNTYTSIYISINTTSTITNNSLLFLNFDSFEFTTSGDTTPNDGIPADNISDLEQSALSLHLGQEYLISFKPIIEDLKGYEGYKRKTLDLNLQSKESPLKVETNEVESNEIRFIIYSRSDPAISRTEKTKTYDFTDLISNVGGFYGAIAGIFVLFFGMNKHEPWGLAQKYLFSCTPCRKSLKRKFAKKYVSSAGIPLVEEVNKRPKKSEESNNPEKSLISLEERIQILENLLEDYYLDVFYLKKVEKVANKHIKQKDSLKQNENNKSIDKKVDEKAESINATTTIEIDEKE